MVDAALANLCGADVVAVLTRAPSAGGKTRLFAELGRPCDPALLEALLLDTVDGVRAAAAQGIVCVEPAVAVDALRALVPDMPVIAQTDGDLGQRMRGCMDALFDAGVSRVALVGSDLPTLSGDVMDAAFRALDADPRGLVLGPSVDGGYFLIAAASTPPVFDGIRWGRPDVLAQTVRAAALAGWNVQFVSALSDVDDAEGLARAAGDVAPRTAAWVSRNIPRSPR